MVGKSKTWTGPDDASDILDYVDLDPDIARLMLLRNLAGSKERVTLPRLKRMSGNVSTKSLARTLREAALDGLVRIHGKEVELTDLGLRVAQTR